MKKTIRSMVAALALLTSCGGGENAQENSSVDTEQTATQEEIQTLENTQQIEAKAESASQKADSILNSL